MKITILLSFFVLCFSSYKAQWTHVGPISDATSGNTFISGRIDCLKLDAGFNGTTNQILYAGSQSGGLWVNSNIANNASAWTNVNIPDYVTYHGITAIEAINTSYLLASTYNYGFITGNEGSGIQKPNFGNIYLYYPATNNWVSSNFNTICSSTIDHVTHIRVCPTNSSLVLASATDGIYRSTDGGQTWGTGPIISGNYENIDFVLADWATGGYVIYTCGENNVLYSTDLGISFTPKTSITSLITGSYYADMSTTFNATNTNTRYIYFDVLQGSNHHILKLSIDKISSSLETINDAGSIYEPAGASDRMCVGAVDQIMYFGCGGLIKYNSFNNTFYDISSSPDIATTQVIYNNPAHSDNHDFIIIPTLNKIIYGNDGGCYLNNYTTTSTNGVFNNNWQSFNNLLNISQIWGLSCAEEDPNEYMTGEQDTKSFRTNALTTTYSQGGVEASNVLIDKFNKNNYLYSNHAAESQFSGSYNGLAVTPNPFQSPTTDICTAGFTGGYEAAEFGTNMLFQNPNRHDKIYFAAGGWPEITEFCTTTRQFMYKKRFTDVGSGISWDQNVKGMAFSKASMNKVYAILTNRNFLNYPTSGGPYTDLVNGAIYSYTGTNFDDSWDGHNDADWQLITPNTTISPFTNPVSSSQSYAICYSAIVASDWDPDRVFVSLYNVPNNPNLKIIKREGGVWQDYSTGIPTAEKILSLYYEQGTGDMIYAGTNTNVYYRNSGMSSWALFSGNLPNLAMSQLRGNYTENTLRVGTYGQGMWKIPFQCPLNPSLNVTGTINSSNYYEAINIITAQNHTVNGGNNIYRSTTAIDFLPDVLINSSSTSSSFAFIHGCALNSPNTFRLGDKTNNTDEFDEENIKLTKDLEEVLIYPNPNAGIFYIVNNIKDNDDESPIAELYDVTGKLIFKTLLIDKKTEINIPNIETGVYVLQIITKSSLFSKHKVVIIK